jgi:hypothetical protein
MQTLSISDFFMVQRRKIQNLEKGGPAHKSKLEILTYKLLKTVCDVVWDMHLLKTSIIVTKTPWTTLKSLSHKYIDPLLVTQLRERMFKPVKELLVQDLWRGLKQFLYALFGRLEL